MAALAAIDCVHAGNCDRAHADRRTSLAVVLAGRAKTGAATGLQSGMPKEGALIPDFNLPTLDGRRVRLSELRGSPVLINFWATWCGPCEHLVQFGIHDVDLEAVREAQKLCPVQPQEAIEMGVHGLSASYVQSLVETGLVDLDTRRLIEFSIHGVHPDLVKTVQEAGLPDLNAARVVELRIHGATSESIQSLIALNLPDLTISKLIEMHIHHVRPEFAQGIQQLGFKDLSARRLIEMRIHGVSLAQAQKARQVYGEDLTAEELVEMAVMGSLQKLK